VLVTHNMTQLDLATRSGVSKKHVNQIVQGQALPSAVTVAKLARVLDSTRPLEKQDGGRRLARALWSLQSQYVLAHAFDAVEAS